MRKILGTFLILSFFVNTAEAQRRTKSKGKVAAPSKRSSPVSKTVVAPTSNAYRQLLTKAMEAARNNQYQSAASQLFSLSRRPEAANDRAQIKYILGLMLMEMKLNQVAAFQFVDVIRLDNPKYKRQAIEKLSVVADILGDDTLLDYAISRVDINDIPVGQRDMINFRIGEVKSKNRDPVRAADYYGRVQIGSSYYNQALFGKGLAELEQNKIDAATETFRSLLSVRGKASVTDTNKVAAQIAMARAYYQKQDWDAAIEAYAQIPRDHFMWHQGLFEQSWAMLRGARFRSVLSNFQSLHSAYYEDFYIPESLLLRAIVYLYICKYTEMEKVLTLFEKTYGPVRNQIQGFLKSHVNPMDYFVEVEKANEIKKGKETGQVFRLPYIVTKNILEQGNVRRAFVYLRGLADERARIESNPNFKNSALGFYALRVNANRNKNKKLAVGDMIKSHLTNMRNELADLYEQASFIRYEMISGKKETLKKKIAGTDMDSSQIDDKIDREFYIENGYQYYPFKGEYWLDEIGNYHYLGKQSCE